LIERNKPDEIKELMRAELDFNREKLEIIREHELKNPDSIECRKDKIFRRYQYLFLMISVPGLFFASTIVPVAIGATRSLAAIFVLISIALNGRDRDNDADMLVKILKKINEDRKMSHIPRLIAIFTANSTLVAIMLACFVKSGIDISNTTLIDNVGNIWFMFDYMAFMIVGIVINIFLITFPSKKHKVLVDMIKMIDARPINRKPAKNHKRQAA
jgi:hypothetical protein